MNCISVDAGGTYIKLAAVGNDNRILFRDQRPSPRGGEEVSRLIAQMLKDAREQWPGCIAGLSFAGYTSNGKVTANQLDLWDDPLQERLFQLTGQIIPIENDGICALTAEKEYGELRGCATGIMLTLGTGIGGGILFDGRPYRGQDGRNMEIGHIVTHTGGRKCSCGQSGCWEEYAACPALSRACGGLPVREIVEQVKAGRYLNEWQAHMRELAQGILSLGSLFYPEKIVLGGGLANCGELLVSSLLSVLSRDQGWNNNLSGIRIRTARFLNDAGVIGAAAIARKQNA